VRSGCRGTRGPSGLKPPDVGERLREVPTQGQEGQRFPQGHHERRRPIGAGMRPGVDEGQGRGFEQGASSTVSRKGWRGTSHAPSGSRYTGPCAAHCLVNVSTAAVISFPGACDHSGIIAGLLYGAVRVSASTEI
jgi:hypothetical protein